MNKTEIIKTRTIPFVFSDETRDSHGTVLPVDGWILDRFNKNGIAFFNHNSYSSDPNQAIGTGRAWVEGKRLLGEITFEPEGINPLAETVFQKFISGTYKGVSVRFLPVERGSWGKGDEALGEKNETYYFGKRELIEISVAPLPSNKNSLVRTMGKDPIGEEFERTCVYGCVRAMEDDEDDNEDGENNENEDDEKKKKEKFSKQQEIRMIEADASIAKAKALFNN